MKNCVIEFQLHVCHVVGMGTGMAMLFHPSCILIVFVVFYILNAFAFLFVLSIFV